MIDFFVQAVPVNTTVSTEFKPFEGLPTYKSFPVVEHKFSFPGFQATSLLQPGANPQNYIFSSEESLTLIYGYCITNKNGKAHRLSAAEVDSWFRTHNPETDANQLRGGFTLVHYSATTGKLVLVADQLNTRNAFYVASQSNIQVSSSIQVLAKGKSIVPDPVFLIENFLFAYAINDASTPLKGIMGLQAGHTLAWQQNLGAVEKPFWNPFQVLAVPQASQPVMQSVEQLDSLLQFNLEAYMRPAQEMAIALTGGYDSRTVLAMVGQQAKKYLLYSWGRKGSLDLDIPKRIADKLGFNYQPFFYDEAFEENFLPFANLAVGLGEGTGEPTKAHFPWFFRKLGKQAALTGLFGSELIKPPTSLGYYLTANAKTLLLAPQKHQNTLLEKMVLDLEALRWFEKGFVADEMPALRASIQQNELFQNSNPGPTRLFHFVALLGARRYFTKEIRVQRPFVENLHPFFDVNFIKALVSTPFAWVHNYGEGKSLKRSLSAHRLYAEIAQRNLPALNSIISTHGYRPSFALNPSLFAIPAAIQYQMLKKSMSKRTSYSWQSKVQTFREAHTPHLTASPILLEAIPQTDVMNSSRALGFSAWFAGAKAASHLYNPITQIIHG